MKAGVAGLSGTLALVLLLPMEAGVPIPVPADLVMFAVGERVAAGKFPLWLAVTGFEVIAILGTTALFLACRGPAQRIITRFGPRLGLTEVRLRRAADFAETRGRPGLALGRGTPGLRTLTVIAAGVSGLNGRRALPALIVGSSVFLQLHLVLGLLLGPAGRPGLRPGQGPGSGRGGRAGRRRGGLLADQEAETGGGACRLDGGELPGVHRREPAGRPRARPGRADRAGPGPPGTR
jgi:membrane protein DedA with SNARE-associated domain